MMYTGLLHIHNLLRWLVLISAVVAIIMAFSGWSSGRNWKKQDNISGLLLTIFIDLQFVIGIILYAFVSPVTKAAFIDFSAAMKNADLRFYAVEHILLMIIGISLIHIGRAKSKKRKVPFKKHKAAALFFTLGLIFILAGIPWSRALL